MTFYFHASDAPEARAAFARRALVLAAASAASLPSLVAYNVSPSPTFLNQAIAFMLWAAFVMAAGSAQAPETGSRRSLVAGGAFPLLAALALLALAAAWSWGPGALPASLGLSSIATLFATMVIVAGAASAAGRRNAVDVFAAFCWGWAVAGLFNVAIALIQVFFPDLADGDWIAASGSPGRAVGNLRQPNHLSSLLMWCCIAVVALHQLGRLRRAGAALLLVALVYAVVLTASRTGVLSVLLLAAWGVLDRRLSRSTRALLLAAPLLYLLSWLAMAQWAAATQHSFGGQERLAESDISSSRFAIWRDTLALVRMHPWTGVGFGEFNFAWTLTPFPQRPTAFFDHTHDLPLQLLVELGIPLAALVMALLVWALWRGWRHSSRAPGEMGAAQRSAMMMVLMIGLHSLLEYPLWYSYFLLPAAWAWGFALQPLDAAPPSPLSAASTSATAAASAVATAEGHARPPWSWLQAAAALVVAGAVFSVFDYWRVAAIFSSQGAAVPLEQRIARGQRSWFFAHHADYAAVTTDTVTGDPARAFDRVTHYLLDTRLMIAWAKSLAARGEVDAARHLAARLREFRNPDSDEFFDECLQGPQRHAAESPSAPMQGVAAAASSAPFQCESPGQELGWRRFVRREQMRLAPAHVLGRQGRAAPRRALRPEAWRPVRRGEVRVP